MGFLDIYRKCYSKTAENTLISEFMKGSPKLFIFWFIIQVFTNALSQKYGIKLKLIKHDQIPMKMYTNTHIARLVWNLILWNNIEENWEEIFQVIDMGKTFLNTNLKALERASIDKWDCINLQGFHTTKERNGMEKSAFTMRKIWAILITGNSCR